MLRKANTKSSNRIGQRKSTSSISTKQDHIDPETARLQAQAAATYAFARAYERDNAKIGSSGEVSSRNQALGQGGIRHQHDEERQRGRGLRRQQSVRFMGPEAVPRSRAIRSSSLRGELQERPIKASLRPRALTNDDPVPAEYRPPSRSSSIGKASVGKVAAQSIVTALAAYDEYYTREDDVVSTPSSYRRMRKSKSTRTLCSPSKAASASFKDVMTTDEYNARVWRRMPWIQSQQLEPTLRAPKSMSFLPEGRDRMTQTVRENHDNAVQVARDKFLRQIEQQRLREQPSFLFRAKARREEKPFRQSVRSSSGNSCSQVVGPANQFAGTKEYSLRSKVRKASQTIRKKLRELFKLDTDQFKEATIPVQQVEARVLHGSTNYISTQRASHDEGFNVPRPSNATALRVTSDLSSLHSVPFTQQLKSHNGSVRSQRSDGSEKSRVTSWTNTAENTATSRHTQAEREAQRLSIIQENGMHIPKTSSALLRSSSQLSAYPMFHKPRSAQRRRGQHVGTIDSQKVYSALMRRLDENSPGAKLEAQCSISGEKLGLVIGIPLRSSSICSHHSSQGTRTPATIRHVQDDRMEWNGEKEMHNKTVTSLPHEDDDVFSPRPLLENTTTLWSQEVKNEFSLRRGSQIHPQQQAAHNEVLLKPPTIMRETRSTFFGNSSLAVIRSTSPYRRALAAADYLPTTINGEMITESNPNRILFAPPIVHCSDPEELMDAKPVLSDEAYTESVYSRTTSGQVPAAESSQSLTSLKEEICLSNSGSVILGDPKTYQPTGPTRNTKQSFGSSGGKSCSTQEVTMVENAKETACITTINHAIPPIPKYSGHFRERAQITDDDTDFFQPRIYVERQPAGVSQQKLSQILPPRPILKHKVSISLEKFPLPPPPAPPLPPPIPTRSSLRPMQLRTSPRSLDSPSKYRIPSALSPSNKQGPFGDHQPLRPNSAANINRADTPSKFVKRVGRRSNDFHPSPGIGAAVERQFGSGRSRTPYSGTENHSPAELNRNEQFESLVTEHKEMSDIEAQTMGSRVMVDMFLSSRRRKVAGSDESNAFL